MSFAAVLLAPFLLPSPDAGAIAPPGRHEVPAAAVGENPPGRGDVSLAPAGRAGWTFRDVAESFRVRAQNQVRIEQHLTIRVAPRSRSAPPPRFVLDLPERNAEPRFVERSMGRCMAVSNISGVQPDSGNRLILFLRDRRMVSAVLERACRARDFYSGFYIERTSDGQLCVDRDMLLSRSGAHCKLTRIRQLVDMDD